MSLRSFKSDNSHTSFIEVLFTYSKKTQYDRMLRGLLISFLYEFHKHLPHSIHGKFDTKTSSWIKTPPEIRKLGGAIFADFRYNTIYIYHNGAESYYAARAFRGYLSI